MYISRDQKPWIIASPALYGVQSGDIGDKDPILEDADSCFRDGELGRRSIN